MRRCTWIAVVLACPPGAAGAAAPLGPLPPDRDGALVNAFEMMCHPDAPSFDGIEARAKTLNMKLAAEKGSQAPDGAMLRQKAWVGSLTTGPFELLLDDMSGPKGTATGCAVSGQVADVDRFRAVVARAFRLKEGPPPQIGGDGARWSFYQGTFGPGTTLTLRDLSPVGTPEVTIKLLSVVPY